MTDTIDRSGTEDDHVLDHLIVRFAGDSGDGMQLTGDRFTSVTAAFGNDLSTLPDFPAEIRAPAGTVNGVSAFQVNIANHKITTPGDEPSVLVAMNPAALMADLHRLEPGGTVIINEDAFDERNLEKAGYTANPLDDDTLANYRVLRVPMTSLTKEVCEPLGVKPPRRRTVEELLRARARVVHVHQADRPDPRVDRREVRHQRTGRGRQQGVVPRRLQLRRNHRSRRPSLRGPASRAPRRRVHEHHRQHRARLGNRRRRPAREVADHARVVSDHPGERHPPRAVQAQALRDPHGAGRRRDRRHRHGTRRLVRRTSRRHHDERPRRRPQERNDVTGGVDRTAAADRRHPARRPVDRTAHQDRGGRPQHRALRPPRRSTAPDRRRVHPGAVLPCCHRGDPHRPQVPHPGDPALRRLPGQRFRVVESAVDRVVARHLGAVHDRTEPRRRRGQRGVLAVPARRADVGSTMGHPRDTRIDAPRRWPREGRRHRQHRLHAGEPREDGPPACRQDRSHRHGHPADRDQRRRRCRRARARLGLAPGRRSTPRSSRPAAPARRWRRRTSCTSTHSHPTSATSCTVTSG